MKQLCKVQFEKVPVHLQSLSIGKDIAYIIEAFLNKEINEPKAFYFMTKDFNDHAIIHSIAFQTILNHQEDRYVYIFSYVIDYTSLKPVLYETDVVMYEEKNKEFKKAINVISKGFCYDEDSLLNEGFIFENEYIPERFQDYKWNEFI